MFVENSETQRDREIEIEKQGGGRREREKEINPVPGLQSVPVGE